MVRAEPVYAMVWPMKRLLSNGNLLTAECNPALIRADSLLRFIGSLWKTGIDAALVAEARSNSQIHGLWVALPGGATEDFKHGTADEAQRMFASVAHKQRIKVLRRAGWPELLADITFISAVASTAAVNHERN